MNVYSVDNWSLGIAAAVLLAVGAFVIGPGAGSPGGAAPSPAGGNWRLGEPVTYENLTIFPILSSAMLSTREFVTLDEALASGDAVISERSGAMIRRTRDRREIPSSSEPGASVNQLVLVYRGKKPLLLLAGELVSGGKQDRIIGKDRIVPVGADPLPLDVFCVEHGRWSSGSNFSAAKTMVHPSVRGAAAVEQDQSSVWSAVRSGSTSAQARGAAAGAAAPQISENTVSGVIAATAPTESYRKIYESREVGASVDNFVEEIQKRFARQTANLKGESVVGVVVAYGGEVAWGDAFASHDLFERYWMKLLRSYAVEALARPGTTEHASVADAREFLEPLTGKETVETEPGVYRWREHNQGRYSEIELEALSPQSLTLHWLKLHRLS